MSKTPNYLDCWLRVAESLFSQALAGEPSLTDALPKPMPEGSFGFAAILEGDEEGRFAVMLDGGLLEATLLGEGVDQRTGWAELLREAADAAAGDLLARSGKKCQIKEWIPTASEKRLSRALQLKSGERTWLMQISSELREAKLAEPPAAAAHKAASAMPPPPQRPGSSSPGSAAASGISPGLELLLDVELEASLRFGAREMPLGEILDLGPGDVVQLDRHVNDPVDLIVGDKIVARGEVVLVNGNFGLRVTEVAEPQRRLESIRCLF